MFLFISILLFIFGLVILGFLGKIILDSMRGGKWGINTQPVFCPRCGEKAPTVRQPTSTRQAMWGGWTCSKCGCEMDKWGTEISPAENSETKKLKETALPPVSVFDEKGKSPVERLFEDDK